jgi:2-polyprenyl-3-methyl-5-hydroxy-6-metoxy-1,4-benzoquinol methylase
MKTIHYKHLDRGTWSASKLSEVKEILPSTIVSDIGAGFGWSGPRVKQVGLNWQPFDYVRKIEESTIWDLNQPEPQHVKKAGFVLLLEVLEHLPNPEMAIKHIANHMESGAFIAITTPNPFYSKSKFTMLFKSELYAFQPKHLIEHHVFVPLPHVVEHFLKRHGLELLEYGVLGHLKTPVFRWSFNYFKNWIKFIIEKFFFHLGC